MRIAIIGSNDQTATPEQVNFAYHVGKTLMDHGFSIVNGGMGGIMEASAKGAHESDNYAQHKLIAILPRDDYQQGNALSGVKIATHLGLARNRLVLVNADCALAIGGGAGTLNEITIAWEIGLPIAGFTGGGGWSAKVAGIAIDSRRNDTISAVTTADDVISWINSLPKP